jgi:CIC family chloride channel protein
MLRRCQSQRSVPAASPPSAGVMIGLLAALAVALFRHAMVVLETLFLGNDSGSLVNAAQSLPAFPGLPYNRWRRAGGQCCAAARAREVSLPPVPPAHGCFDTPASLVKSLASLLVVVTGSAIGREGAMILAGVSKQPSPVSRASI